MIKDGLDRRQPPCLTEVIVIDIDECDQRLIDEFQVDVVPTVILVEVQQAKNH